MAIDVIYLGNIYGSHIHDGFGGAVFSKGGPVQLSKLVKVEIGSR